ncbi:MAG: type VI secretion system-associated FHA domain protein TagH [Azoarcus sp.]|jgi:type VI secretion system FHA domain protein|nr:type VI secretion system-associated FHA domain protein TagH [Azoarcus sp.]
MLEICALTYNDLAPVMPITGIIPDSGGTIGRGNDNFIILPDPASLVSRQHLRFSLDTGNTYKITNISSSNTVFVNEQELGPGMGCLLRDQDKIMLGGYVLQARHTTQRANEATTPASPAAPGVSEEDDFIMAILGSGTGTRAMPAAPKEESDNLPNPFAPSPNASVQRDPVKALNERGVELGSLDNSRVDDLFKAGNVADVSRDPLSIPVGQRLDRESSLDPLAIFGNDSGGVFDDILQPAKSAPASAGRLNPGLGPEIGGLFRMPESGEKPVFETQSFEKPRFEVPLFDPASILSAETVPPESIAQPETVSPTVPDLPRQPTVGAGAPQESGDTGGAGGLGSIDAFIAGLSGGNVPASESPQHGIPDDLLFASLLSTERNGDTVPSRFSREEHAKMPDAEAASRPSGDDNDERLPGELFSGNPFSVAPPSPSPSPSVESPSSGEIPGAVASPTPVAVATSPLNAPAMEALYKAFIEGLGVALPGRTALDEAFMNTLGRLLRHYTQGVVELIAGRAIVKQAVKANITVIAPERNNPLKFSPDGEAALLYLLGRPFPGFMEPVEAVRTAFIDLRGHQIGVISGMQSALGHVLNSFDPAALRNAEPSHGFLDNVFPSRRKAQLWDAYARYFQTTRENAMDHFQSFFGAAFLEAYEKAISTVQAGDKAGKS